MHNGRARSGHLPNDQANPGVAGVGPSLGHLLLFAAAFVLTHTHASRVLTPLGLGALFGQAHATRQEDPAAAGLIGSRRS
jgi:hypothetical protein